MQLYTAVPKDLGTASFPLLICVVIVMFIQSSKIVRHLQLYGVVQYCSDFRKALQFFSI